MPVDDLITAVKSAIQQANISVTNPDRDLAVTSVYLKLNTVATAKAGGGLDFRVPFIGLRVKVATSVTRQRTHMMELTLSPEDTVIQTRGSQVDAMLVEAIETVRAVMARAAAGDDPFTLRDSAMELSFGVAQDGTISLGLDGELTDEITHTLRVTIAKPADRESAVPPPPDPPEDLPRNVTPLAAKPTWTDTLDNFEPAVETARAPAPPPVPAPAELPSVDRHPTAWQPLPAKVMRIGRTPDNDLVLPDLEVSRYHAELRRSPAGSYEITDLGSTNGIYVNGQQIATAVLTENDLVSIGHSTFRLKGDELRQYIDEGEISFAAQDLVVRAYGGRVLLDRVTFPVYERCLLGIIGPAGSGKSTLLGALTGMRPADAGTVLYDNRDLYRDYAELRHRIGLVPQESVLHTQLTARRALQYSAQLRFPTDTGAHERDARVDEVMAELGLTRHANTRADRLSGGQLKRLNVAQELLTKPSLLFLDEPTAGLDPGLDKSVMEQMRDLAHDGRTVIMATSNVMNLHVFDRLLVLAPGGRVAFYGPPDEGLRYFGLTGWAEVFQDFERYPDRDWAGEYAASPAHAQYVLGPRVLSAAAANGQPRPARPAPPRRGALRQVTTLTRRYARVISADRGYLAFMVLLPIVLGTLLRFVGGQQGLNGSPHAADLLLVLVTGACLAGAASSIRELVKERPIYLRERAAGLSSGAYLASKLIVLGAISIVQSVVLVLLGVLGKPLPPSGSFLTGFPLVELLLATVATAVASMCLGLLVSALVATPERAMPVLVLLTLVQVILSGALFSLSGKPVLEQLAYVVPARWGFAAMASTARLNVIGSLSTDSQWVHTSSTWLTDMAATIVLAMVFALLTWLALRRQGPRRRPQRDYFVKNHS